MKSPKIPKPPDPYVTAAAQTGSNQSTAQFQQMLNMQDQKTPYGSVTWAENGSWSYKDPVSGQTVTVPKYGSTTTLSPAQQALLDQEQQFDARFNDIALQQTGRIKDALSTPFDYNPGAHEAWAGDLYNKLNSDSIAKGREGLEQNLANRGLQIGTKAYDDAVRNWDYSQQKARNDFMLNSYGTGMNTALTKRNQPLNEATALMGGGQITQPTFVQGPQAGVANTDLSGNIWNAYNANVNRAQAQGGTMNALGQLGGAALGGWLSDERAKETGPVVGTDPESGLPVKEWRYTPTAQDVAKVYPEAVEQGEDGMMRVNWLMVPGGEKFIPPESAEPMEGEPRGYQGEEMNELPPAQFWPRGPGNGNWQDGPDAPGNWPWPSAKVPPWKYMGADAGGKGALQRLGSRRAVA